MLNSYFIKSISNVNTARHLICLLLLLIPLEFSPAGLNASQQKNKKDNSKEEKIGFDKGLRNSKLASGINYKVFQFKTGDKIHIAHVIETDLDNTDNRVSVLKAKNNVAEVEKLHDMINRFDSTHDYMILGAINASFWRAYSNQPMGPVVISGEVVEWNSFKSWSSAFFDKNGKLYIDRFQTDAFIRTRTGKKTPIVTVNRRRDSLGVVLFNKFYGKEVPFLSESSFKRAYTEFMKESMFKDKTDKNLDSFSLKSELLLNQKISNFDYNFPKIGLKYIDSRAINKDTRCVVYSYTRKGTLPVPKNGCVLSYGMDYTLKEIPKLGDTIVLRFTTDIMSNNVFWNVLCGTPRLVRNGKPNPETKEENLRSKRFIDGDLQRTAIGSNKDKNKLFLVAVEGTNPKSNKMGVNLKQLSYIMRRIGAWDAINLDGGGSTAMVINNKNVVRSYCPTCSRSISVGLGIARKKVTLKGILNR